MSDLRSKIIRLAHQNPEMRPHLLPLVKKARWDVVRAAEKLDSRMDAMRDRQFADLLKTLAKDLAFYGLGMDLNRSWIDVVEEEGFVMHLECWLEADSDLASASDISDMFIRDFKIGVGIKQRANIYIITVG